MVEHLPCNQTVFGSSPKAGANKHIKRKPKKLTLYFYTEKDVGYEVYVEMQARKILQR